MDETREELQEIKNRDEDVELFQALLKFQKEISPIVKTETNPFFKSKYADINQMLELVKPVLNDCGLYLEQAPSISEKVGYVSLATRIIHADSGYYTLCESEVPLVKNDAQAVGSAYTYLRRYQVQAMLGLQAIDDDAESNMVRKPTVRLVKAVNPEVIKAYIKDKNMEPTTVKDAVRKHFKPKISAAHLTDNEWDQLKMILESVNSNGSK